MAGKLITRLDHVVVAVRDLAQGIARYREMGFDVRPGGRHGGRGTENAIIRFGLEYIELLSVYDRAEAEGAGIGRRTLVEYLEQWDGGLIGWAAATDDIDEVAERLRRLGKSFEGPFAMSRQRPDGTRLSWRLLIPEGTPWRRPWPFVISWDMSDEERLALEAPGDHPNGATRIACLSVVVKDLERTLELYHEALGLVETSVSHVQYMGARKAVYLIGNTRVELLSPTRKGVIAAMLEEHGEGPVGLTLATPNKLCQLRESPVKVRS